MPAQMVLMIWKNNKKENEASNHQNNDDPTRDEEENNTYNIRGIEETYQMTTNEGSLIYSRPFSQFTMSMALSENFKLLMTLKPYDETEDLQVHVTMFKSMMLVNGASDLFLYRTFPTFLEKVTLCGFCHYL